MEKATYILDMALRLKVDKQELFALLENISYGNKEGIKNYSNKCIKDVSQLDFAQDYFYKEFGNVSLQDVTNIINCGIASVLDIFKALKGGRIVIHKGSINIQDYCISLLMQEIRVDSHFYIRHKEIFLLSLDTTKDLQVQINLHKQHVINV